ncbi:MAG: NAD(P)H-hydrate dehydratase [Burkholderiaceae bacterium]
MDSTSRPSPLARERSGFLTVERIRRIEASALSLAPTGDLMARAAAAVCERADVMLRRLGRGASVMAAVGPGNNGGDALLALTLLARRGYSVLALSESDAPPSAPEANAVHGRWRAQGGGFLALADIIRHLPEDRPALLIDGLFGIGLTRPLGGASARFADLTHRFDGPVLAIDVPSGLDAERGSLVGGPLASAVRATDTVTMIADKPGLHTGQGPALSGRVCVATLGLSAQGSDGLRIDRAWAQTRMGERSPVAHKGSFGTAVIVGGAANMPGAALLAAQGARAMGAGKIATLGPDGPVFSATTPQIMSWQAERPSEFSALMSRATALTVGCGLGTGAAARSLLGRALELNLPLCLDADALNLLGDPQDLDRWAAVLRSRRGGPAAVLTPHPLEAARLLGCETRDVERDRLTAAREIARRFEACTLLKGAGSVLAGPDGRWGIVTVGSAALATGGTGDLLAGMVGGLLAQGYAGWEAAGIAAVVHGQAAQAWHRDHPRGVGLPLNALLDRVLDGINAL